MCKDKVRDNSEYIETSETSENTENPISIETNTNKKYIDKAINENKYYLEFLELFGFKVEEIRNESNYFFNNYLEDRTDRLASTKKTIRNFVNGIIRNYRNNNILKEMHNRYMSFGKDFIKLFKNTDIDKDEIGKIFLILTKEETTPIIRNYILNNLSILLKSGLKLTSENIENSKDLIRSENLSYYLNKNKGKKNSYLDIRKYTEKYTDLFSNRDLSINNVSLYFVDFTILKSFIEKLDINNDEDLKKFANFLNERNENSLYEKYKNDTNLSLDNLIEKNIR